MLLLHFNLCLTLLQDQHDVDFVAVYLVERSSTAVAMPGSRDRSFHAASICSLTPIMALFNRVGVTWNASFLHSPICD